MVGDRFWPLRLRIQRKLTPQHLRDAVRERESERERERRERAKQRERRESKTERERRESKTERVRAGKRERGERVKIPIQFKKTVDLMVPMFVKMVNESAKLPKTEKEVMMEKLEHFKV